MKPAADTDSGGVRISRITQCTWPLSTYLALAGSKTSLLNRAQWVQLAEAYSVTVIGASALPTVKSPSRG